MGPADYSLTKWQMDAANASRFYSNDQENTVRTVANESDKGIKAQDPPQNQVSTNHQNTFQLLASRTKREMMQSMDDWRAGQNTPH